MTPACSARLPGRTCVTLRPLSRPGADADATSIPSDRAGAGLAASEASLVDGSAAWGRRDGGGSRRDGRRGLGGRLREGCEGLLGIGNNAREGPIAGIGGLILEGDDRRVGGQGAGLAIEVGLGGARSRLDR